MADASQNRAVPALRTVRSVRYALSGEESRIMLFMMNSSKPMANRTAAIIAADLFPSK